MGAQEGFRKQLPRGRLPPPRARRRVRQGGCFRARPPRRRCGGRGRAGREHAATAAKRADDQSGAVPARPDEADPQQIPRRPRCTTRPRGAPARAHERRPQGERRPHCHLRPGQHGRSRSAPRAGRRHPGGRPPARTHGAPQKAGWTPTRYDARTAKRPPASRRPRLAAGGLAPQAPVFHHSRGQRQAVPLRLNQYRAALPASGWGRTRGHRQARGQRAGAAPSPSDRRPDRPRGLRPSRGGGPQACRPDSTEHPPITRWVEASKVHPGLGDM